MIKTNGTLAAIPNRALASARASIQSFFAFSKAEVTSDLNGSPAKSAPENFPLSTG
ncbi:unannotated protein [freshwater metagenome]|uniref:Unannotated protein n=1 Tax=freshwater metagenome TaxID=449393 RepID=A0A6J6J461_9ZZZZ